MNKYIKPQAKDFTVISEAFLQQARKSFGQNYDKVPSEKYSTARMGGYLIKDVDNMVIGWVPKSGSIDVYDYIPQTSETVKEYRR